MNLIRKAWCATTSADPDHWSPMNPAWGQCAVTALVVQDLCGGKLVRVAVGKGGPSHYFNELDDGSEIDLTIQQFDEYPFTDEGTEYRERNYLLSFPDTVARYHLLWKRLRSQLDEAAQ